MASPKRKFTDEQKLEILRQANEMGVITVIRNHNLSYSVFARWREKFMEKDKNKKELILKNKPKSKLKQFMEDNTRLKKIIAEQALDRSRLHVGVRLGAHDGEINVVLLGCVLRAGEYEIPVRAITAGDDRELLVAGEGVEMPQQQRGDDEREKDDDHARRFASAGRSSDGL